jgi:DNA invertase Pin-like site-specific DNA recombinase
MEAATEKTRYIAYYRVSTKQQGSSGLGLEAQRAAVHAFVKDPELIAGEFTEVESGKNNEREQLRLAIAAAKEQGARLVIAKLDRLSRNAGFIFTLKDSGVDFVCCDMPDANTLTVGIFAVLAQHERELISSRTRAALAAKKAQGFTLGSPQNLTPAARAKGAAARKAKARDAKANKQAASIALDGRAQGSTLRTIADKLNSLDYRTTTGKAFHPTTVKRLLDRAAA